MSILSQILADKKTEVHCSRRRTPSAELEKRIADMSPALDFAAALSNAARPALIAEVKKASPSKGIIREDFDPVAIAKIYAANGAACLSVLTDEPYFQGHLSYLRAIREAVDIPLLRKDFIIDDYQLLEARAAGADAVLLITAALSATDLEWLLEATYTLGMRAIVEVHDAEELDDALASGAKLIGINNRDLHTFRTTLKTTVDLVPSVPEDCFIISESGINKREDVERLRDAGVHAVLVGEALMREPDIAAKMQEMLTTG
jgi:indole-3-glycerol phosphate synthase